MDSSFLTFVSAGLGLFSLTCFFKMLIQFGLPNHPARFTSYLVSLCAVTFFCGKAAVAWGLIAPWDWARWEALPVVAGSLALLLQTIMTIGQFSLIQQKVVSRLPLIAALLCFAFFPSKSSWFFIACIVAGSIFLSVSVGRARYQKRLFFKMVFFLGTVGLLQGMDDAILSAIAECLQFFILFYFFLFEQTFGVAALMDKGVRG